MTNLSFTFINDDTHSLKLRQKQAETSYSQYRNISARKNKNQSRHFRTRQRGFISEVKTKSREIPKFSKELSTSSVQSENLQNIISNSLTSGP